MNIYLISQGVNNGYDTYDSAVVIAVNEEQALSIHPSGDDSDNSKLNIYGDWAAKEDITAELIGTTNTTKSGVIIASFNAG